MENKLLDYIIDLYNDGGIVEAWESGYLVHELEEKCYNEIKEDVEISYQDRFESIVWLDKKLN